MIRDIKIRAVMNGFVVDVGCQTVVFSDVHEMTQAIASYIEHPEFTEKHYLSKPNAKHTMGGNAVPCDPLTNQTVAGALGIDVQGSGAAYGSNQGNAGTACESEADYRRRRGQ